MINERRKGDEDESRVDANRAVEGLTFYKTVKEKDTRKTISLNKNQMLIIRG